MVPTHLPTSTTRFLILAAITLEPVCTNGCALLLVPASCISAKNGLKKRGPSFLQTNPKAETLENLRRWARDHLHRNKRSDRPLIFTMPSAASESKNVFTT